MKIKVWQKKKGYLIITDSNSFFLAIELWNNLPNDKKFATSGPSMNDYVIKATPESKRTFSTVTKDVFMAQLVRFFIKHSLPFKLVESMEFQKLLFLARRTANEKDIKLPSATTLKLKVTKTYDMWKIKIKSILQQQESLCFTCDAWKSAASNDFLAICCHYIDSNWVQQTVLIAFEPMTKRHTGN